MAVDLNNPSQRTPCLLVLDASGSMNTMEDGGKSRIQLLNDGLRAFHTALHDDPMALSRVQIAAVNAGGLMGSPKLFLDWTDASEFEPFEMTAATDTPLGEAILVGLSAIEQQKTALRQHGLSYTRPWVMVLTDGEPTDNAGAWTTACAEIKSAQAAGKIEVFPIGIGQANLATLGEISHRPPLTMNAVRFREFFVWLSSSLGQVARSVPGANISLPSTDPWASVRL